MLQNRILAESCSWGARPHLICKRPECKAVSKQAERTPYGTPYSSVGGFSNLQTPPHSLTGYSPLTHFHGSLGSSHLGTPSRSVPSGSLQVTVNSTSVACSATFANWPYAWFGMVSYECSPVTSCRMVQMLAHHACYV